MTGERLSARFSLRSQFWFRWTGKCFGFSDRFFPNRRSLNVLFGFCNTNQKLSVREGSLNDIPNLDYRRPKHCLLQDTDLHLSESVVTA